MSKRQDAIDSINHKQPETIPWDIRFTKKSHEKMASYYNDRNFDKEIGNCFTIIRANIHREVEPGVWKDQFGVVWDRRKDPDIGVVIGAQISPENIDSFDFPNPDDPQIYEHCAKEILEADPDTLIIVKMSYNLFERAWALCGYEQFLVFMMTEPDFINKLLDRIVEYNLRVIDNVSHYQVDGILFGDDWGQQNGLIMGPELWHEYIEPRVKEMYARVGSYGLFTMLHSCGNITEVIPQLIDAGLDVLNPFQPEAMDIYDVKKKFGDQLSFYGGLSTQKTLPFESVKTTIDETQRLIDEAGHKGGLIVSAAHAIPGDAKPENIAAMIETLQGQHKVEV